MQNEIKKSGSSNNGCDESSHVITDDYQFDKEINEQKFVRSSIKEGMIVFDVGAHLGEYTKLFSLLAGDKGRVYAFEPTPGSFGKLSDLVRGMNRSNVTLINKAVYSENCKVVLNEFPEKYSAWNSLGRPKMKNPEDNKNFIDIADTVEVEAVTLDSFCQQHNISRIDYLKVDVEGAEIEALRGASGLLENKIVQCLQFEISKKMLEGLDTNAKTVFDFLKSKGYDCRSICPDGVVGDIVTDSDSFFENYIAYPSKIAAEKPVITKDCGLGVIILGHTRPVLLRNTLESLKRQGKTSDVHVWLDGDAGRATLKAQVQQCREIVTKEFSWAKLTTNYGNIGIEKLMIDGLSFMAERYDKIVVLEDDCFPTAIAITEFNKALDSIKDKPSIYSVYGHHFLIASEGETLTRFQGWGWATTKEKLLSILPQIKKCFAMQEPEYLEWVRKNLTPEVVKRLDVTPGRNCVPVIASHFCWDGCTCLLTAMRGLSHKKTAKRVIYNCGLGDSMHFGVNEKFLKPPFNMIHPKDVWNYYDDSNGKSKQQNSIPQTATSMPVIIPNQEQSSKTTQIIVEGILFKNVQRTKYQNNSVGFSDNYIIKIEHEKHPRKLRNLSQEIEIVKYLNSKGCISCPKIISDGTLKSGERYYIQQRITGDRPFSAADMIFSMLEQKSFGVCQGDLRKDNLLFNSNGVCYIIDYDQALMDDKFGSMGSLEFIEWNARYMEDRWREFKLTDFYKWGGYDKQEIYAMFNNEGSFNLANTTIFKEQITTNTKSGIYHTLRNDKVYIEGCRDLNPRLNALNSIEFKKGEKVLDIGCNMGLLCHYLYDKGCTVTGVDMDPKVVIGAKMTANILGKDITFVHHDMDEQKIKEDYDTICLFSVIHHVKKFEEVTANITKRCNRIILEVALKEKGSKPVDGKWTKTSGWEFTTVEKLVGYLEGVFRGFKLEKYCGNVDRERHIITLAVKQSANINSSISNITPAESTASSQIDVDEKETAPIGSSKPQYLVSAIISTYNAEKYLGGCLEDLENQTIADKLEIVVVDSGSQQNEAAIVKEFQKRYNNIKYIRTERETIYDAWNRAIKASSGKYITNANTDDRLYRDSLEILSTALEQNPGKALAYGNQHLTTVIDGEITGERLSRQSSHLEMVSGRFCPGSQPMWRRDLHDSIGYFDERFFCSGDYELWIRATQHYEMLYVDVFTGKRLMNNSVVSNANKSLQILENLIIQQCYEYVKQTGVPVGKDGLSGDARMADRPEINLWKRRTASKLCGKQFQGTESIFAIKDSRGGQKKSLSVVVIESENSGWQCLKGLAAQGNQDFELIIISYKGIGGQEELAPFAGRTCILQFKEDIGISFARNAGISYSKGDFIAYLYSDMIPDENWAEAALRQFADAKIMAVRGQTLSSYESRVETEIYSTIFKSADNCILRTGILRQANGFNEDLFSLEGLDFSYRIYEITGHNLDAIKYEPGMVARFDQNINESRQAIETIRDNKMFIQIRRNFTELPGYIEFFSSRNPAIRGTYELDYNKLTSIVVFLKRNHIQLAQQLMEQLIKLDPKRIKWRYMLGCLYIQGGNYNQAAYMMEYAFQSQLLDLNYIVSDSSVERMESDFCVIIGTELAQCYNKSGQFEKLKELYLTILNNPRLQITAEMRTNIEALAEKLGGCGNTKIQKPQINFKPADKKKQCLVTAIVSTYNSEKYLRGCLEDLESQTIADKTEIIVVNSGSQQNEEAIVKEFQTKYDNIVYIKTENREGLYSAWNRAIKAASGQFVTNANTDDRHRKDALENLSKALIANPEIALVYGDQIVTDTVNPTFEKHNVIEIAKRAEFSKERLLFGCCIGSQPMWRKSLHNEFGMFDETLDVAADWDFWLKAAQNYSFKHIPETLGLYYHNEEGLEHGQKIHSLYERYAVGRRYGNPYISIFRQYQALGNPLVSVVMPAYNAANYIGQAIESILIQNYRNFEIIVIDDGSTDKTADIVRGFKNEPIQYFFKKNGGVASARNLGVRKAQGSFIVMLDSDDMMTPDYIASHLHIFEQRKEADMVYCDDLLIDENNKPLRVINRPEYSDTNVFISDMFKNGFPVVHFKTCIRKSVFDKIGQYDERLIIGEDYDMIRRFAKEDLKMVHLPGSLYLRRITADSLTKSFNAAKAKSHFEVIHRFTETFSVEQLFPDVSWDNLPAGQREMVAKCKTALVYLGIGEQYLATGATDFAEMAFDMASEKLDECCKIDPADQRVKGLREKCLFIKENRLKSLKQPAFQPI